MNSGNSDLIDIQRNDWPAGARLRVGSGMPQVLPADGGYGYDNSTAYSTPHRFGALGRAFQRKNLGNLRVDIMATPPHETLNGCESPSRVGKASCSTFPANFKSLLDFE